jgi:hypothetical protein
MKYPAVLTFAACVALLPVSQTLNSSTANSGCSLKLVQSPEIRGIRLGMTSEQLLTLFPEEANRNGITEAIKQSQRVDKYGVARFDLRPDIKTVNPRWTGVNYITIELTDERVTSFHISYAGPEWKSVDQLVAKLSEVFRLPDVASWEPGDESRKSLKCNGFVVDVYAFRGAGENWVRVQDTSAPRLVEDRRRTAKEKERQAFKP